MEDPIHTYWNHNTGGIALVCQLLLILRIQGVDLSPLETGFHFCYRRDMDT